MKIDVLTLFPEMFVACHRQQHTGQSCRESGILEIRSYRYTATSANDRHNRADDYPFGGGGGMVMMADPVFGALESVEAESTKQIVYMSPQRKAAGFRR